MQHVSTILVILAVTVVMRVLLAASKKKPALQEDGSMELRLPGSMAVIGYLAIGFGALITVTTVFQLIPTTGNEVAPYLVLFFVLLGLLLVLLPHGIRITVTEECVRRVGLTGRVTEIRWDAVERVRFSVWSELVLYSGQARIRLNTMLVGFESFLEMVKRNLDPALTEKALLDCEKTLDNIQRRTGG